MATNWSSDLHLRGIGFQCDGCKWILGAVHNSLQLWMLLFVGWLFEPFSGLIQSVDLWNSILTTYTVYFTVLAHIVCHHTMMRNFRRKFNVCVCVCVINLPYHWFNPCDVFSSHSPSLLNSRIFQCANFTATLMSTWNIHNVIHFWVQQHIQQNK